MSGPDWSTINPGLVRIFGGLVLPSTTAQSPAWVPEWADRKVTATPVSGQLVGVKLYLKITSVVGIGEDDRRLAYIAPSSGTAYDDQIQETIYGLRRVTLNLQCTSTQASDASWAMSILERIRTRLSRRRVIDDLLSLNIGIVRVMPCLDISRKQDQHIQSRANMDVILTMVASDSDPVPTGWIHTLVYTSHVQDVSGIQLPTPPNVTNVIVTSP